MASTQRGGLPGRVAPPGIAALIAAAVALGALPARPAPSAPEAPREARALLDRHCAACHGPANPQGGLDLTALGFDLSRPPVLERWARIHDRVAADEMPPGKALPGHDKTALVRAVAEPLVAWESARVTRQGRSVLRRLNRYEYENTVRDLLGAPWLELRDRLPEDGISHRFNKAGEALDVSHVQMARYMEAADEAIRLVLDAWDRPERTARYYAREQQRFLHRMRYSPFNRHPERASIPVLGFEAQPDVLAETVPITVGPADPATRELEAFAFTNGTYTGNEYHFDQFAAPAGGLYRLRFNAYSIWVHTIYGTEGRRDRGAWWHPDREKTSRGRTLEPLTIYALSRGGEKRLLGSFDVGPEPAVHELEAYLLPGEQIRPDAARLFRSRPGFIGSPDATADGIPGVAYRWMEVTGPAPVPEALDGYRTLFGDLPAMRDPLPDSPPPAGRGVANERLVVNGGPAEAGRLVRGFLQQAYRRSPTQAETERYLGIAKARLAKDGDFAEAMIAAYTAILCSPGFLYLEEEPGRLSTDALASRLSYFLWNAPPDRELRELAASGRLLEPEVLRAQTSRLLDSPRSRDFIDAFLDYWLDLRKLGETTPDQVLYPDYYLDDLLVESALHETRLFVSRLVGEDLPAANLIDSRFTYVNAHLARHYGLPPVEGVRMRLLELPEGSPRGGLMTQASVLKVTANGTTTSPVIRGAWIMERLLGQPPPPPPPSVPAVEPDTRGATTIREQLAKHRSIASCAACHARIDPPGFALENFDIAGGWRDRYRSTEDGEPVTGVGKNGHEFAFKLSQPVDSSGELADGRAFDDVVGFKRLLLSEERQIARNLATQLIVYATGAGVSFRDRAERERILDAVEPKRYGVRSLIHEIVASELFTHK